MTTQTTPDQALADALHTLSTALTAAGEPIGSALLGSLATEARRYAEERAALTEQGAAREALRAARTLAEVAAHLDGAAVALDGGPSDPLCGAAEWLAGFAGVA